MKELVLFTALVFATSFSTFSKPPIYDNVVVVEKYQYSPGGNNILFISSPFAKPELDAPDNMREYKGRKIVKVTYLYSQNNIHPTFNQNSLSDNRYNNLMSLFPELISQDGVKWETQVQSGCEDIQCAKKLYHGFIIEFEDKAPEVFTQSYLETEYYSFHSEQKKTVTTESGTKIYIPPYAFVRKDGQEVNGEVYISVKEGVEVEDILFGGLFTMTEDNQVLESGGMVEIKAYNEGYELELKEGQTISVNLAGSEMKNGMQLYTGVQTENGLTWNDPKPLNVPEEEQINLNKEVDENANANDNPVIIDKINGQILEYPIKQIKHTKITGTVNSITILLFDTYHTFERVNYSEERGKSIGLNDFQSKQIGLFFESNNLDEIPFEFWGEPIEVTSEIRDTAEFLERPGVWRQQIWIGSCWGSPRPGTNTFQEDTEVRDAFQMSKLGWANIDRLASFPNSKQVKFAVNVELPDSIEDIKISMVIPDKKMYLPGYEKKDGNYSFTHGDYEEHTFPVGDQAIIIAICEKDGVTWFDMAQITLGENEIENLSLQETDREGAMAMIKESV